MTAWPSVTGKKLVAALQEAGFAVVRVKGSHRYLRHAGGRTTVVPVHTEAVKKPSRAARGRGEQRTRTE